MAGILWDSRMWVCQCCMLTDANGECCADNEHGGDGIAPWSDVDFSRFSVTMGLLAEEHDEECPVRITGDHNAAECDCEHDTFSTSRCDGCGSFLHGDRYAFALWREPQRFATGSLPA
jgi:hypothetical protein